VNSPPNDPDVSPQHGVDRLASLTPQKRALLEQTLLARRRTRLVGIQPRDRSVPTPLSSSQYRLWFFDQLDPGAPTYNAVLAMWVQGELDVAAFARALEISVARHEVLHTAIVSDRDEPVQVVLTDWRFELETPVVHGATLEDRERTAMALARLRAREPYDLARDLTLRAMLVQVAQRRWLLAVCEHHIAFDGWSDEILFREVTTSYRALGRGEQPKLAELPVQYADFAVWQRQQLTGATLDRLMAYWRSALADAAPVLDLPLDHPRPAVQTYSGRHLPLALNEQSAQLVREFSRANGLTDFMTLVAVFVATLYRWCGQSDVTVGTPSANRNQVELEQVIGFFSNTLPLRVRVDGSVGFDALAKQVKDVALAAFDHQDLPFDKIVEAAAPPRDPRVNPLFQVNVRVQGGAGAELALDGVEITATHLDLGFSRFDLAVEFQPTAQAIGGYLEYNEALFDESTAAALLARLDQTLVQVLTEPQAPLWVTPAGSGSRRRRSRPGPSDG
jgi:hypothetical protein